MQPALLPAWNTRAKTHSRWRQLLLYERDIRTETPPHAPVRPRVALPFLLVALIWGSTWWVITGQIDGVAVGQSLGGLCWPRRVCLRWLLTANRSASVGMGTFWRPSSASAILS
jgi:hypothetical protein